MRYFIFSDTHGNFTALKKALDDAGYDKNNKNHWLISAGDLFDRGKENIEIFEFLSSIEQKTMILGNHDQFLLDILNDNFSELSWNCRNNGLTTTLAAFSNIREEYLYSISEKDNFSVGFKISTVIQRNFPKLKKFLDSMVDVIMIDKNIITHAGFQKFYRYWDYKSNNRTVTKNFIEKAEKWELDYTFIFGHWHAFDLNESFCGLRDNKKPFIYKNFVGIDACSTLFNQVFIYQIESETDPIIFDSPVSLDLLLKFKNLEDFKKFKN